MPRPRVVIGPLEVAGYYTALADGFRALGVACDFVEYSSHSFQYHDLDGLSGMTRACRSLNYQRKRLGTLAGAPVHFAYWLLRLIHFLILVLRNDTFVFGYGQSLLPDNRDLPLLRLLGKRIIMVLGHGSEARPPYLDGPAYDESLDTVSLMERFRDESAARRARVQRAERYADFIVGSRYSTAHFASKPFVSWLQLGIPRRQEDLNRGQFTENRIESSAAAAPGLDLLANSDVARPVRILHSPSKPGIKGTQQIRAAVSRLKQQGLELDYVEIIGQPNRVVLEEIAKCDFVVDQLYSDTPMAGFASEAACFGKPSIVGGYGLPELRALFQDDVWPPSYVCHPDSIELAIRDMATNSALRESLGRQARTFVETQWAARLVAGRYLRLLTGQFPQQWLVQPRDVVYVYGCGLTQERARQNIRGLVDQCGVQALQLSHRPELERALLDFADDRNPRTPVQADALSPVIPAAEAIRVNAETPTSERVC